MNEQSVKALTGAATTLAPVGWSLYKTCKTCGVNPAPPIVGLGIGLLAAFLWS